MVLDSQIIPLSKGVKRMTEKRFVQKFEDNNYEDVMVTDNQQNKVLYNDEILDMMNKLHEENQQLKILTKPVQDTIIEEFTITKEDLSNNQRITELTNHALTEFIKSKGYTLKEVNQFIKEEL